MRRRQPHSSGNTIGRIRRSGMRICGRVQSHIRIAQGSNLCRLECSGGSSPREFEGTFAGGSCTGLQFDQNQQLAIVYASNFPVKRISVWTLAPRRQWLPPRWRRIRQGQHVRRRGRVLSRSKPHYHWRCTCSTPQSTMSRHRCGTCPVCRPWFQKSVLRSSVVFALHLWNEQAVCFGYLSEASRHHPLPAGPSH